METRANFLQMKRPTVLLVWILFLVSGLGFLFSGVYHVLFTRERLLEKSRQSIQEMALQKVQQIEATLRAVEKVPENIAYVLENTTPTPEQLLEILNRMVKSNKEVFGSAISLEPDSANTDEIYFSAYAYKDNERLNLVRFNGNYEQIYKEDWYAKPKALKKPIWSEPYYDAFGAKVTMTTYSVPFFRKADGIWKFTGVITADVTLEWFKKGVDSVRPFKKGFAFIVSQNGMFIAHPNQQLVLKKTIFQVAQSENNKPLEALAKKMISRQKGFARLESIFALQNQGVYYIPIAATGWSLGISFPYCQLAADCKAYNQIFLMALLSSFLILLCGLIMIGCWLRCLKAKEPPGPEKKEPASKEEKAS